MRQKLLIFAALIVLIVTLIGLNAVSYTQKDTLPDSEESPNRSTYNAGATGTRAFYELLAETGRRVTCWQENPSALSGAKNQPDTFVIVGATRLDINEKETEQILRWVSAGGKLVIIDRAPVKDLILTTANWSVSTVTSKDFAFNIDPSNPQQMTEKTNAVKPVQPTVFTRSVNAVQPSRFASSINLEFSGADATTKFNDAPPAVITENSDDPPEKIETVALNAPFVHLANSQKTILVDFPYGSGQIVYLTDPYIVSNAGISLVDNAQMAINIVASGEGLIAFDEYHHGYGASENRLLSYFAETPFLAIFAQIILLAVLLLWSQSRRFARPLPADEPNRLSKLEYVAAFAELQQRTKAYDLALENIYTEFRRKITRHFGMDNHLTPRKELAQMIAERGKFDELEIYNLMRQCEEIIHGEPTNKKEILRLTSRLREIEETLGIKRTRKQAFGK